MLVMVFSPIGLVWMFKFSVSFGTEIEKKQDHGMDVLQRLPLTRALKGFFLRFKPAFCWTSINRYHGFFHALA